MAKVAVDAEFPGFLVVTAFSVIALADENKTVGEVAVDQTHCQRLAKLCQWMCRSWLVILPDTDQQPRPSITARIAACRRLRRKQSKGAGRYEPALRWG